MPIQSPVTFLLIAYTSAIAVGAAAGSLIVLIGMLPSPLAIIFSLFGSVVGAFIGAVGLTGAIIAFGLTTKLRRRPGLRKFIVAVACGLVSASTLQFAFLQHPSDGAWLVVVVTLLLSTAVAFTAYHLTQRYLLSRVPASSP